MNEFDLISRYFTPKTYKPGVLLGVGDDAAVLDVPAGHRLVTAVDSIVEGIHFPIGTSAADIAYRALAVNLSDMAAMGAIPRWFTLSLCMPRTDVSWLAEFAPSLTTLAQEYEVELVGGDTVRGPLNISIQILGVVESDKWLTRTGAQVDDVIYVSGVPGEAAAGLQLLLDSSLQADVESRNYLLQRFYRPKPRVQLGRTIRPIASAAMDISDGLFTDLSKLCAASHCGARLDLECLPRSTAMLTTLGEAAAWRHALHGGDDYELLFTVAPHKIASLQSQLSQLPLTCAAIGKMVAGTGVQCFDQGKPVRVVGHGFDHFQPDEHGHAL